MPRRLDRIARENGRFEHAVQDTRTALLEVLSHVSNAAFAHDLRGSLTFFNAAAERLFGVSAADALHKSIYQVITPKSEAAARSMLVHAVDWRRAPYAVPGSAHERRGAGVRRLDHPDVRPQRQPGGILLAGVAALHQHRAGDACLARELRIPSAWLEYPVVPPPDRGLRAERPLPSHAA